MHQFAALVTLAPHTESIDATIESNEFGSVSIRAKLQRSGVQVFKGTPTLPLGEPALFLGIVNTAPDNSPVRAVASLSSVRPGGIGGYTIKELISDMELDPEAAVEKAIDIAMRGDIRYIYLNADIEQLPAEVSQSA